MVSEAINLAHTDDEYHIDVLEKTTGCLFLAVPFHGADAASWAELGAQIMGGLSIGMAGNPAIPKALRRNSKDWMKISRDFVQRGKNMTFRSAYETEKMGRSTIVDEASARNNVPNERVFPVPGSNHRNICKFSDDENGRFGPVGLAMIELVEAALDGEHSSKYPLISELPISTPKLYGRNTELKKMSSTLNPSKPGRKGTVLFGIGGSGKTQLALHYIRANKDLYKAIIWINALTPEQTSQSFADAFHWISNSWPAKDLPNPHVGDDKKGFVLSRLRSTLYRNWLLILDSADDVDNQNLLQLIPESDHGSIIVTSTRQSASDVFAPHGFTSIEIDKLDDQSSKELLLGRAGISSSFEGYDSARAIVKELNGLPLALEQAGILLRRKVLSLETFVKEYRTHYKALMGHLPKAGEVQHDKARSMYAILDILYSYIRRESPTAAAIVRLLAIIGPSQIPIGLLLDLSRCKFPHLIDDPEFQALGESSKANAIFRLQFALLEDVCLVKIRPGSDRSLESASLHGAICQWITRGPTEHKTKWVLFTGLALGKALCQGNGNLDWPMGNISPNSRLSRICLTWIDRITFLINEFVAAADLQPSDGTYSIEYKSICLNFGYAYFCNARHADAKQSLSRVLEYEAFQAEYNDVSSISSSQLYYCLGVSFYRLGEVQQAEESLTAASNEASKDNSDQGRDIVGKISERLQEVLKRRRVIQSHHSTAVVAARGTKIQPTAALEAESSNESPGSRELVLTQLQTAILAGDELLARALIENGADVNERDRYYRSPLSLSCSQGRKNVVLLLLNHNAHIKAKDADGGTALHSACLMGNFDIVQALLDHNASVGARDQFRSTPLHHACRTGSKKVVRLLIDHDAELGARDQWGSTPLHYVCDEGLGDRDIARFLLGQDADPNAKNEDDATPLHWACLWGYEDLVRLLLDHNADIEAKDLLNRTPLHLACTFGRENVVRVLLDYNVDIEVEIAESWTALDLAIDKNHDSIVRLLIQHSTDNAAGEE
ncbi:hypothetical protein GGR52DRAFT_165440 [Hypoxylon sp. FL1284]|nr:hypothetical protein GGR52DRAFT_165440 [Hypoxylon sp. FL1284]